MIHAIKISRKPEAVIIILAALLCLTSCKRDKSKTDAVKSNDKSGFKVEYASGFAVMQHEDFTEISVYNPWNKGQVLRHYILVDKDKEVPKNLPEGTLIRTPLNKVAVYSTVQCGILEELGVINTVAGVCEPQYIDIPFIQKGIADGSIADLKMASNPDVEKIMMIEPEAILASPLKDASYGLAGKINIPLIECVDYMEPTPLGRAEWIRFHSLFYGKQQFADSLFHATVNAYNELKKLAESAGNRPTVFTEMRFGNSWYISGGKSYIAQLLKDAGSAYCWENDSNTESIAMSFETVLDKAGKADFWLIKYNSPEELDYKGLASAYDLYTLFDAYKKKHIYTCNTQKVNYYEELPIHPDYVLKDLIWIFHPELLPEYQPRYYGRMKE